MKSLGYIEGQNIAAEYRFAKGAPERLPNLAADLSVQESFGPVMAPARNPELPAEYRTVS